MKLVQVFVLCTFLLGTVVSLKCEGGKYLKDDNCLLCPKGSYSMKDYKNDVDRLEDICYPCNVGYYSDEAGSTYCKSCDYWMSTPGIGSTSKAACSVKLNDTMTKAYMMRLMLHVTIDGELCDMSPALWNIEGIAFYDVRALYCKERTADSGKVWSSMGFEMTTITEYGVGIYNILNDIQLHRTYINAFIAYYGPWAKNYLRELNKEIKPYGIQFDVDRLNLNATIAAFNVSYSKVCAEGYKMQNGGCVKAGQSTAQTSAIFHAKINRDICKENTGKAIVELIVECPKAKYIYGLDCIGDRSCKMNYVDCWQQCSSTSSGSGCHSIVAMVLDGSAADIAKLDSATFNQTAVRHHLSMYYDNSTGVEVVNQGKQMQGCGKGKGLKAQRTDGTAGVQWVCNTCPAGSYAHPNKKTCELCPFNTYSTKAGQDACSSCSYGTDTPLWGQKSSEWCLVTDNYWHSNGSDTDDIRDYAGQNKLDIDVKFEFNECNIAKGKAAVDRICIEKNSTIASKPIEKMICDYFGKYKAMWTNYCSGDSRRSLRAIGSTFSSALIELGSVEESAAQDKGIKNHHGHSLGEHSEDDNVSDHDDDDDDDDDDSYILQVACAAGKPLAMMDGQDLSNNCAKISRENQTFTFAQAADFGLDIETSQWLVPLLDGLRGLVTASTWSPTTVPPVLFERIGINDLDFNGFLNMDIATTIVRMMVNAPADASFPKFNFEAKTDYDSFKCSNGALEHDCRDDTDECNNQKWKCEMGSQEGNLTCRVDPCNNCKATWYYSDGKQFDCKGDPAPTCTWPKSIENGKLNYSMKTTVDGNEWAVYVCNEGYQLEDTTRNGTVKCIQGVVGDMPGCEKQAAKITLKLVLKLRGKKARRNVFVVKPVVRIDGKVKQIKSVEEFSSGGIMAYVNEDDKKGVVLDLKWRVKTMPFRGFAFYKPGKKGQQYQCFAFWVVYEGVKGYDKKCWKN